MLTTRWDKDNKLLQSNLYLLRLKQVGVTKLTPWLQPMIDYVDTKERQGIFFERPVKKTILLLTELILWEICNFSSDWEDPPSPPRRAGHDEPRGWVSKNISPVSKKTSPKNWCWLSKNSTSRRLYIPLLMLFNLYFLFFLLEIPKLSLQQKCKFSQRGPVDWHRELGTLSS